MGKITNALKKAADERLQRLERINRIKQQERLVVKKMRDSVVDSRIITYFDPKALITEQYKILRTNVMAINKTKPPQVLVITSSVHSEGKTITALNLAITMAQSIQKPKVLLIDADMRRGRIAKYLGVDQEIGLKEILCGQATVEETLFHIDIDNLTFLSAGDVPENPAELLSSEKMKQFLSDMRKQFDHIFIDTPPIISVTDSGLLGAQADGVIMVVQAGRTQRGVVKHGAELLHQTHAQIVGYVLTSIEYQLPEYIYRYL